MADDFPGEFDMIVVGTGFCESIIAGAASRIGKTVLHLDESEYYGGFWASFNLESLLNYIEECRSTNSTSKYILKNVQEKWFEFSEEIAEINEWNKEKVLKESRKFNIDLVPKLQFSIGKLVQLLISSNISRYSEFRAVDKILTLLDNKLIIVPCSRSDVFTNKNVNVIEKRLLMKFLTNCVEYQGQNDDEETKEAKEKVKHEFDEIPEDSKFVDLLKKLKLTKNLIHYILYAICMGTDETTFKQGVQNVKMFIQSIGRYGNTPFLFPMYGCGELPQSFCRLCAVFGGVYCLKRELSELKVLSDPEDENRVSVKCGEQTIKTKNIVFGNKAESATKFLSRGLFLTTSPIGGKAVNSSMDGGGVVFLKLAPIKDVNDEGAFVIQLSHFTGTVPKGLYMIHLTTPSKSTAEIDLQPFIDLLFKTDFDTESTDDSKPTLLYSLYFNIPCGDTSSSSDSQIHYACGPSFEVDYDETIRQSKLLFEKIYPNEDFLPRAPEPEEIIIGEETEGDVGVINLGVLADIIDADKISQAAEAEETAGNIQELEKATDALDVTEEPSIDERAVEVVPDVNGSA